ncbi:MAG: hypothetical protein II610_04950 [Treponema sp.]|nr:hypothetical protein [Treponema sp.]
MPGYSQLKKLSETLLKLGNEINLRAQRGEKALPVPIPDTIPDIDDSQDFVLGMPEKPKPPEPEPEEVPAEEAAEETSSTSDVSVDDLLSGIASGGDSLDLSAFGDTGDGGKKSKSKSKAKAAAPEPKKEPEPPPKPKGISGSGYSGFGFDDDGNLENSQAEDKMPDIGALMGGPGKKAAAPSGGMTGIPELDAILNPQKSAPAEPPKAPSAPAAAAPKASDEPADLDSFGDLGEIEVEDYAPPEEDASAPAGGDVDASALFGDDVEDFEMPQTDKDRKPKPVYKPLAAADDLAVLKPDIFTDNPVTKENPPYYVTSPYGTLPEQPAAKESAAEKAAASDDGFSLDDIPEMEPLSQDEEKPEGLEDAGLEEPAMEQGASDDSLGGLDDLGGLDGGLGDIDFNMDDLPASEGEAGGAEDAGLEEPGLEDPAAQESPAESAAASDDGFSLDDIPEMEPLPQDEEKPDGAEDAGLEEPFAEQGAADDSLGGLDDLGGLDGGLGDIDFNMDDLPASEGEAGGAESAGLEEPGLEEPAAQESPAESAAASDGDFSLDDIPEMETLSEAEEKPDGAEDAGLEDPFAEQGAADDSLGGLGGVDELGGLKEPAAQESPADGALDGMDDLGDFDGGPSIDLNMDLPQELGEVPPEVSSLGDAPAPQEGADSFEMPDMDGLGGMEGSGGEEISADAVEAPKSDEDIFSTDGMDFGGFDMTDAAGEGGAQEDGALPGESLGETDEATASALGDFDIQDTDSQLSKAGDDFALEGSGDDFSIPGFSEEGADPYANEGKKGGGLDQVDFSGAVTGDGKQRTQLTEDEYIRFKKNLHDYPLNVRIAVEEMIVKNEFTDEVVFEVIDKVLKKVTARQLAGHLEKMLDISLPVPRDYERRSAEEYEAYKASFAYQLKSRILPAIIVGVFAAMILFCLGYLGHRFIYKPLMAEKLYKEGYVLIEHDEFPQSEDKFNEALRYKSKKKWFFKYAQGYRAKKQYDRAELFYKNILKRFNHDKQAGLEYAQMEVDDLANYELAEEILKREVLDNHVNDPDGILALGDTYLEWGTEKDSAKFANAYEEYSKLQQLYGSKNPNLYQSRFLRYNIRIDQLRNVLELKEFFFTQGEKSLDGKDWTELSGYLMDKQYGELPADQEFLRDKIEDVRDMMLYAIKALPENPTANYNLSRYLVKVGDHKKAMQALKNTKGLFDKAPMLNRREIYRQLDNYRLLGEEYLYDREYILAQDVFTEGLNLFESKNRTSDFEADKNVGVMYSDMGDLDYFISGDLDNARRNYQKSIDAKNDSPSIRYRVGYIDYTNGRYQDALGNFVKASQTLSDDPHLMLALGNTLSLKDDNYAAQGHYKRLLARLDLTREKYGIISPQTDERAGDMVETYMKASNNLGVSLFRVARQSGSSSKNAASLVNFQDSIRYYDAMTRNQETMVRLPGSNLAEMNLKYATHPFPNFEPEIYTEIPRVLNGEKGLKQ